MDYMTDEQYADLTGNTYQGDSPYDWAPDDSFYFGDTSYTPETEYGFENGYFDLAGQLAESGLIPQDQYGAPDLGSLLNMQFSDAVSSGDLGDLTQYANQSAPVGMDAAQQMAIDQANLVGAGYEAVQGNPNVVIDPNTGELIDKVSLQDRMNAWQNPAMSRPNTRLNDMFARDQYPQSTLSSRGDVIAKQGPYSAVYDPEDPSSFERAAGLVDYQAQPGTGLVDERNLLQKLGSGALSLLKGSAPTAQSAARTLAGNTSNAATQGQKQGMSLAEMVALAAGVMQGGNKGSAPGDSRTNPTAQNWQISRKAGSGRKGALQQLKG